MPTKDAMAPSISVVMPCYNEGKVVLHMIERTARILRKEFGTAFEIIVVDDGSTDQTYKYLKVAKTKEDHLTIVHYKKNKGKGHALKKGLKEARGAYVAFIDSDLEIPPQLIPKYLRQIQDHKMDVVFASKIHPKSTIHQSRSRKALSFASRKLTDTLFGLKNIDTQAGLKVFRREVAQHIIPKIPTNSFAFDIELFVLLKKHDYRAEAAPVFIYQRGHTSKVHTKSVSKAFLDVMKIYHRHKRGIKHPTWRKALTSLTIISCLLLPMEAMFELIVE